ncbi:MAG: DEAD/DEAH box helicase [Lentisphaeria bacterium]
MRPGLIDRFFRWLNSFSSSPIKTPATTDRPEAAKHAQSAGASAKPRPPSDVDGKDGKRGKRRRRKKSSGAAKTSAAATAGGVQKASSERSAPRGKPATPPSMEGWKIPSGDRQQPDEVLFQDFPLDPRILRAIVDDLQFRICSPIQGLALPHVLAGKDIAGKAQTGTGKTAAFLVGVIQKYLAPNARQRDSRQPMALALAPTRELALQIAKDADALSAYTSLRTVAVFGGMDYERQKRLLNDGVDLVVATPGRLIDYLRQGAVDCSKLDILVIDEADRMLDMGFIPDVKRIVTQLPKPEERQTMLFSATLSRDIMNLASRWMRPEPVVVEVEPEHIVATGIDETIYAVSSAEKMPVLLWTLENEDCERVLIFRNRRRDVEELHRNLQRYGVSSEILSGDVDQKKRLRILEDFRNGAIKVIVATDVAGRGIHVDNISHVINYDLPYEAEDYVHRIGRTARAGSTGRAISFADEGCSFVIPDIEKFIDRALTITTPTEAMIQPRKPSAPMPPRRARQEGEGRFGDRSRRRDARPSGTRVRRGGPRR